LDGCDVSPDSAHLGPAGAWQHRGGGSGAVLAAEDWLHVASHLGWFKVEAQWRNLVLAVVRIGLANGTPMSDIDFLGNIDQHTRMNGGKKKLTTCMRHANLSLCRWPDVPLLLLQRGKRTIRLTSKCSSLSKVSKDGSINDQSTMY
jgi:hypothetical protein